MHPITPRLARAAVCAAVAVPVLLVAGCSSDSGETGPKSGPSPSPSASKPEQPVKYSGLPDPCKAVSEKTIEDVVPGTEDKSGENLTSADTDGYGACLWSGGSGDIDAEYRALTVSLKRYDSAPSLGSGAEQAKRFFAQESKTVRNDEANKELKESKLSGLGQEAVSLTYETEKKDNTYRASRVIVRDHNVVVTVDYEGTGFEDADPPSRDDVRKKAEKVAKEAAAAIE